MATRVLIAWAHHSTANLGVRVLAEGSANLARAVWPDAQVETQNYGQGSAPTNIGVPRRLALERVLDQRGLRSWIRGFDVVIDTRMGDSFADIYGLPRLRAQCAFAEFVGQCDVPLVLGPQTIGPFDSRPGRALGRWSLRRADLVMARDYVSAQAAAALGRPVDVQTTDVVFTLPVPEPDRPRDVVLNVSGLLWEHDTHGPKQVYRAVLGEVIESLRSAGREVTLLAHVLDSDFPDNDGPTVRQLGVQLGLEAIVPDSLDHARAVIAGAQLVIGSRMHSCLNALSMGVPAVPLAYSRKFAPLLADIGWSHVVGVGEPGAAARVVDLAAREDLTAAARAARERAVGMLRPAHDALRGLV